MALPCVRHSVALQVKLYLVFVLLVLLQCFYVWYVIAHVKYDRGTLLQLRELSHRGHFDINVLDSLPELHLHTGVTPGQAVAGRSSGARRPTWKRGR